PRRPRANSTPEARHRARREGRGARAAQDRDRTPSRRAPARRRPALPGRRRPDDRRLLPVAQYLFVRADGRGQGDVSGLSSLLGLARAHGGVAHGAPLPGGGVPVWADRARAQIGALAPAKILILRA